MLGSLLGYNLIVFVPLIVLSVKMASAPPHTLLPVITKTSTLHQWLYPLHCQREKLGQIRMRIHKVDNVTSTYPFGEFKCLLVVHCAHLSISQCVHNDRNSQSGAEKCITCLRLVNGQPCPLTVPILLSLIRVGPLLMDNEQANLFAHFGPTLPTNKIQLGIQLKTLRI